MLSHEFGNPVFDFLPGKDVPLAWWFNFLARLCLTLETARLLQWFLVDQILLTMSWAARWMGPLVTLHAIQSRGWPFLMATWSIVKYVVFRNGASRENGVLLSPLVSHLIVLFISMFVLCGFQDFAYEWFLDLTYTPDINKQAGRLEILSSEEWLRFLVAMLAAGLVTSMKRTVVAMFFGRRTFGMLPWNGRSNGACRSRQLTSFLSLSL